MIIRIKDNIFTKIDWWDQIVKLDDSLVLKNITEDKPKFTIVLVENQESEKLINLFEEIHYSVAKNVPFFDVPKWLNRNKKRKNKPLEK